MFLPLTAIKVKAKYLFLWFAIAGAFIVKAQQLYFPPLSSLATWETITPQSLNWCTQNIDSLYNFLEAENSKGFIVLKDGKIVLEKYFGTFTKDSNWYWASAGKSLTSLLVGIAQEEGYLSINDSSSKYLGAGWTNTTPEQEGKITIKHQITMTTGLDDAVTDNHCTIGTCLIFKANAGTRWAYHNAPYTLLDGVINVATGQPINAYTQAKIKPKTGITGAWVKVDYDNVFVSTPRSMARYGLLAQNNFIWANDTLLRNTAYKNQMVNTSEQYNLSYGYLWWLNGKASYMFPTSQIVVPGWYAPNAPADMVAAIGKNGQLICVSKNTGLVMIRMGDATSAFGEVPTQFCDKIWQYLNKIMCTEVGLAPQHHIEGNIKIYPNPSSNNISIMLPVQKYFTISISNVLGEKMLENNHQTTIDISGLKKGIYVITVYAEGTTYQQKFVKE